MSPNTAGALGRIAWMGVMTSMMAGPGLAATDGPAQGERMAWMEPAIAQIEQDLGPQLSAADQERLRRGLRQVGGLWRAEDGDATAFREVVASHFAPSGPTLDTIFTRCEQLLEVLNGHMEEISREFRTQVDLDLGPILPIDEVFAGYSPGAHVLDDFFDNKLAFAILLNFPLTTLDERLAQGEGWSRRQWAEARLAQHFSKRVPGGVNLAVSRAAAEANQYISTYNIWMHHLVDARGQRLFPPRLRLLAHWNLRDQLKSEYADGHLGLARQRLIYRVMERIITQTIPAVVIDNPGVDWDPVANAVSKATVQDGEALPLKVALSNAPEPDTRYATWLKTFRAVRLIDPYSPTAPTHIARRFDEDREIPEARVRTMLEQIAGSPLVGRVAALIRQRLGRPLEPFDIWYNGFLAQQDENRLDPLVRARYPTAAAFEADIPSILTRLGFKPERARLIASRIAVDPARGSGHALGAAMRSARAHLRTRVEPDGMNYKGLNIAMHELGHNVEQVISLHDVDHTLLACVPNTAFTEAMAFVFQARDLEILGLGSAQAGQEALRTLNDFWATYEIAGVALVDMAVWHWMYAHPEATPAELKAAVLAAAREVWNKFYAPVLGGRDVTLLAVYSHMVDSFLYLPDYPIGHLIAFQIEERVRQAGSVGPEIERMARLGSITPDLWMRQATGAAVGNAALLAAVERALAALERERSGGGKS